MARERGLDGVCLTEHDRHWEESTLEDLRNSCEFPIFTGVEVTTDMGHVLAFGLKGELAPSAAALFERAERERALLFLAHPARDGLLKVTHETVEFFRSVEAINGSDSRLQNVAATGLAKGFSLPGIGGSDAHSAAEVGRAATRFAGRLVDDASLLAALRGGEYQAVYI